MSNLKEYIGKFVKFDSEHKTAHYVVDVIEGGDSNEIFNQLVLYGFLGIVVKGCDRLLICYNIPNIESNIHKDGLDFISTSTRSIEIIPFDSTVHTKEFAKQKDEQFKKTLIKTYNIYKNCRAVNQYKKWFSYVYRNILSKEELEKWKSI